MLSKPTISFIEKASSFAVLLVLMVTLLLVYYFQSHFNPARLGFAPVVADEADSAAQTPFDLQALISPGWVFLGGLEQYDAENLYEKINGKAPLYLESGFSRLYTQKIINSANEDNWAEVYIYDMSSRQDAFSVYSVQRRSIAVSIEGLDAGYYTGNAAFAAIDHYYLEVIGSNVSQETIDAAKTSILNFNKLSGGGEPSSGTSFTRLFPAEHLLTETISLTKSDAFGFDRFKDTYLARYEVDSESMTAFVIICADEASASELNGAYREFLTTNGFQPADAAGQMTGSIYEYSGIYEIVFSKGQFVGGIHEAFDRVAAEQIVVKMTENFERIIVDGRE